MPKLANFELDEWMPKASFCEEPNTVGETCGEIENVDTFGLMLDAVGKMKKDYPLDRWTAGALDLAETAQFWAMVYKGITPKGVKKFYLDTLVMQYYPKYLVRTWGRKETKKEVAEDKAKFMKEFCMAFKFVYGCSFKKATNILKGIAINKIGKTNFYASHYLRKLGVRHFTIGDEEAVAFAWKENKSAVLLCMCKDIKIVDRDYQKDLKDRLMRPMHYGQNGSGWTEADWKFFSKQTQSWKIRAIRYNMVDFAVKARMRDAHMRNSFIKATKRRANPVVLRVLQNELRKHKGPITKFAPFEVRRRDMGWYSREMDIIADYVYYAGRVSNATTLRGLYREAEEWHREDQMLIEQERIRHQQQYGGTAYIPFHGSFDYEGIKDEYTVDGIRFELIKTSEDLYVEGRDMHHCVGSYKDQCGRKEYVVFKVHADKQATLGCYIDNNGKVTFEQMYGVCNEYVDESVHKTSGKLIDMVNKDIVEFKKQKEAEKQPPETSEVMA